MRNPTPDERAAGELRARVAELEARLEDALAQSRLTRAIFRGADGGAVGFWEINVDGTTAYANAAMRRMLEIGGDEPIEGTYHRFFSERSFETFGREHEKRREGAASTYEVELVGARGARRHVLISGVPVMSDDGELGTLVGAFIDVTDLRQTERKLAESEAQYRSLFEHASDAIFVTDPEGRYLDVNRLACELTGYSREELLGLRAHDLLPQEELERDAPALERLLGGETIVRERLLRRKDGSVFPTDLSVTALPDGRILGFARDITERRRTEEALARSHANLRALFRSSLQGILFLDRDGRIQAINDRARQWAEQLAGRRLAEGDDLSEAFSALGTRELGPAMQRVLAGRHPEVRERRLTTLSGEERWFEFNYLPVVAEDGSSQGVSITGVDVTDRKRAEQERLTLEKQLQQSQRLEALGRLAGGVAHDFNNLLTAIVCHTEALLALGQPGDAIHQEAQGIQESATRAAQLTRQLLAFGRRQVMRVEVVDLAEHLRATSLLLRRLIPEHIELRTRISPEPLPVDADPAQLDQIVMNLALNARDAMLGGGVLEITAGRVTVGAGDHVALAPGDYAVVSVADTGHGMDEETQAHIFEPFFSTKDPARGTGLGLATTYGIVAQHEGHIELSSLVGRGSTFVVYLPLSARGPRAGGESSEAPAPRPRGGRILLAEDDDAVRRVTAQLLTNHGYEVRAAAGGSEAIELALAEPPDLLLTDVVMPGMSGPRLHAALRERLPRLRVVFMSGYAPNEPDAALDLKDPGLHFVMKPFSPEVLIKAIDEALEADGG